MKSKLKSFLFFLLCILVSSFTNYETNVKTDNFQASCTENFTLVKNIGRDCLWYSLSGPDISNFTFAVYTVQFSDGTSTTFKVLDSSNGFQTNTFGPGCATKYPVGACGWGRYVCDNVWVYSHHECI